MLKRLLSRMTLSVCGGLLLNGSGQSRAWLLEHKASLRELPTSIFHVRILRDYGLAVPIIVEIRKHC